MLRLRFGCQFAILVLLFATPEAQASSKPSEAELAAITARGVLLAEYDTAAWQATDTVQAAHPVEGRVGRYIARKTDAGWVVAFGRLNEAGNKFLLAYEAVQTANAAQFEVRSFDPVREDTSWNLAAAKAIETAIRDLGGTSRPYNIAVLPTEHENMYVYLYPAQVKAGVYPLGADVRYRVSPDGMKIIEKRQMHKTIIESVSTRTDMTVEGGYHTHVLSEVPEDTDVFLVLTRQPRVLEVVVAGAYMFTIDVSGKISVEDRPKPTEHTETVDPKTGDVHLQIPIPASTKKQ
ncbi:MAG: hypothetical protein WAN08_13175 [Candidatus Sulfotelmatobacter sp.]